MKYSNHGYGLLGLIIKAITGEPYAKWIKREIVDAAGLKETTPDMPLKRGTPFARGHTGRILLGRRLVIPATTRATRSARRAASSAPPPTSRAISRSFAQRAPEHHLGREPPRDDAPPLAQSAHQPRADYGLGTISGTFFGWDWFGHSGGLQGYISRTCVYPQQELTVCVLTNALDGWAHLWVDGAANIMQAFQRHGAPSRKVKDWNGRFWSLWAAIDLVPMGNKVLVARPASPIR